MLSSIVIATFSAFRFSLINLMPFFKVISEIVQVISKDCSLLQIALDVEKNPLSNFLIIAFHDS